MNTGEDVLLCVFVFVQVSSAVEKSAAAWCSCQQPDGRLRRRGHPSPSVHHQRRRADTQAESGGTSSTFKHFLPAGLTVALTAFARGGLHVWDESPANAFTDYPCGQIHCAAVCRVFLLLHTRHLLQDPFIARLITIHRENWSPWCLYEAFYCAFENWFVYDLLIYRVILYCFYSNFSSFAFFFVLLIFVCFEFIIMTWRSSSSLIVQHFWLIFIFKLNDFNMLFTVYCRIKH